MGLDYNFTFQEYPSVLCSQSPPPFVSKYHCAKDEFLGPPQPLCHCIHDPVVAFAHWQVVAHELVVSLWSQEILKSHSIKIKIKSKIMYKSHENQSMLYCIYLQGPA